MHQYAQWRANQDAAVEAYYRSERKQINDRYRSELTGQLTEENLKQINDKAKNEKVKEEARALYELNAQRELNNERDYYDRFIRFDQ